MVDERTQIYNKIKASGIWPGNQKLVSSNRKGDVYIIPQKDGDMYVRVQKDARGKEKVTWVS
jgi:hypothetical protein